MPAGRQRFPFCVNSRCTREDVFTCQVIVIFTWFHMFLRVLAHPRFGQDWPGLWLALQGADVFHLHRFSCHAAGLHVLWLSCETIPRSQHGGVASVDGVLGPRYRALVFFHGPVPSQLAGDGSRVGWIRDVALWLRATWKAFTNQYTPPTFPLN